MVDTLESCLKVLRHQPEEDFIRTLSYYEGVKIDSLPTEKQEALRYFDTNGDGIFKFVDDVTSPFTQGITSDKLKLWADKFVVDAGRIHFPSIRLKWRSAELHSDSVMNVLFVTTDIDANFSRGSCTTAFDARDGKAAVSCHRHNHPFFVNSGYASNKDFSEYLVRRSAGTYLPHVISEGTVQYCDFFNSNETRSDLHYIGALLSIFLLDLESSRNFMAAIDLRGVGK